MNTDPTIARIALFTVRSFAVEQMIKVIEARPDAELVCVLTTPGPKKRRSHAHCEVVEALHKLGRPNVDVIVSNTKSRWADLIALYKANLILCSGFPWLIPESVLTDPRLTLGVVNFHNSHLPKWVGPNAFGWYIISGAEEVGYCAHRMGAEFDTGSILLTETVPLDINEDYQDLKKKMPEVFCRMINNVIDLALEKAPGDPQVGESSYAPKFDEAFRWIDFNACAKDVHNKVRAFYGERDHPKGALAKIDGEVLCFTKTRFVAPVHVVGVPTNMADDGHHSDEASLTSATTGSSDSGTHAATSDIAPGTVLSSRNGSDSFYVRCGDTCLEVLEWHKVE